MILTTTNCSLRVEPLDQPDWPILLFRIKEYRPRAPDVDADGYAHVVTLSFEEIDEIYEHALREQDRYDAATSPD